MPPLTRSFAPRAAVICLLPWLVPVWIACADIAIEALKTDVRGVDLQVLKSGGEQLRRVGAVRTEIINGLSYESFAGEAPGTEQELVEYMSKMGFRFVADVDVVPERRWLDKVFVNEQFEHPSAASKAGPVSQPQVPSAAGDEPQTP
jgi:hypothetical protein